MVKSGCYVTGKRHMQHVLFMKGNHSIVLDSTGFAQMVSGKYLAEKQVYLQHHCIQCWCRVLKDLRNYPGSL